MDDPARTVEYWAGPGLVTAPGTGTGPAMAILVLWHRAPAGDPDDTDHRSRASADLTDRGFARLPGPGLAQLHELPRLPGIGIHVTGDGRLRIDDGSRVLFEGARYAASDDWHAAARDGRLALLVDVEPVAEDAAPYEADTDADALARFTSGCRARTVFGARVDVVASDDGPVPTPPPDGA